MKTIPVGTRLDPELHAAFLQEMARRGQDKSQFLRTIIRDALARYDSCSEQILQTQLAILEYVKKLQEMIGATVHLEVEHSVLALPQEANETNEAYKERLKGAYRAMVYDALAKGARIAAAPANKGTTPKVGHDH
jgi:hypothetical protein